jgi:hypothetical protein
MSRYRNKQAPIGDDFQKLKEFLEKEYGRVVSDEEVSKSTDFIHILADIMVSNTLEQARRLTKLEEYPKGFHLDKTGYTCIICDRAASGENSWYDSNGLKCMACQQAINKRIIPVSVAKNKDSYYTSFQLDLGFNLDWKIRRRWVKQGLLKDRIIPGKDGKGVHLQLFLLKDNKGFLPPPKKLGTGGWVKKITPHGGEEYAFYPWYYFVDPIEHLKEYGIVQYLRG